VKIGTQQRGGHQGSEIGTLQREKYQGMSLLIPNKPGKKVRALAPAIDTIPVLAHFTSLPGRRCSAFL